jgi:hypothetical protein
MGGCRSFLRRGVRHEAVRRDGRSGSIRGRDLAGFGGHDLHGPQPAESGFSRRAGWVVQRTDVVIAQPVEDELELSSGGGHGADVAVAAAMSHLFADRADVTGIGQALHRFDRRPPHQARALLGDPAAAHRGVGFVVGGR